MGRSLYLVNPLSAIPGYFGADVVAAAGMAPMVGIADLATATVAAFAPAHWQVRLCDEHVAPADPDPPEDFVGLTGKVTQGPRLVELARGYRARGKRVIVGGPYASLEPERVRAVADVLVIGEIEALAPRLFADLEAGRWQNEYVGDRPGLEGSPPPRWDLYPHERALIGCVQTSRGCPFECEFCDVIAYLGRRQRHKPVAAVVDELTRLYALGFRNVFLADDNFTAYRRRTRELLLALRDWNATNTDGPMRFSTQVSLDAARDEPLVALAAAAGIDWVFIGLETPNPDSLRECRKPQNLAHDMSEGVATFLRHGIAVTGGMIVGFDHDGPEIFERQLAFAQALPVPVFSLGALAAPAATPLHARLAAAGRLLPDDPAVAALPWGTNVVPQRMSREELLAGLRSLARALYDPAAFGARMARMAQALAPHPLGVARPSAPRPVEVDAAAVVKHLAKRGADEAALVRRGFALMHAHPQAATALATALFRYAQVRHLYEQGAFWEPVPAAPLGVERPVVLVGARG